MLGLFKKALATEFQRRAVLTSADSLSEIWFHSRDAAAQAMASHMNGTWYYDNYGRVVIKVSEGTYAVSMSDNKLRSTEVYNCNGEEVDGEEAWESSNDALGNMKTEYGPPEKAEPTARDLLQAKVDKMERKPNKSDADKRNLSKYLSQAHS